ncbi:MAG: LemA family protein [Parcubacteria group bacterium]|nr:LemA family protein [Parcubacteria group bacterium]
MKKIKTSWILIGIVVLVVLWLWSSYNGFVSRDEGVKAQWANVEAVYQRRLDLIPNIVNTVKGAAKQDLDVFTEIADARSRYTGAGSVDERAEAATRLESALARLLVIVENYPTLKSQESFLALVAELEGTENRISVERRRYNEAVQGYNIAIRTVPRNLIAGLFGFGRHELFEAAEGAEAAPAVDFGG